MFIDIIVGQISCYDGDKMTKQIMPAEILYEIWSSEPEVISILDVRAQADFIDGHIPGSRWIEPKEMNAMLEKQEPSVLTVVVCDQFNMNIPEQVNSLDCENAIVLDGGLESWKKAGFPISDQSILNLTNEQKRGVKQMGHNLIFQQLFEAETSTYTYLLADKKTKEAVIIDPVYETADRDLALIHELGLKLIYILDTHVHADHITGAAKLREKTGAKTVVSGAANVECVDVPIEDGQELRFGEHTIKAISTQGHTDSCMSYYTDGMVFTGDSLMIRGAGRTDFQQGSSQKLYQSITQKIFALGDETIVYPGHDYRGFTSSTIGIEKKYNPRIGGGKTEAEFVKIMSELKLANPKKIHEAVPANLLCGNKKSDTVFSPQIVDGVPEITPEALEAKLGTKGFRIIDVRTPEEFNNELAHVPGAELVTLGGELENFLQNGNRDEEIVFTCRSGARSGNATIRSRELGYKKTMNMTGGMIRWNNMGLKIERT